MWRFKASKFKNAVPKIPKKGEGWITDISVGSLSSFGNHIKASASLVAFNVEQGGQGNLGIIPINKFGSQQTNLPLLRAHAGFVTDFDFCPYDDYVLATASDDCHVKLWRVSDETTFSNPVIDVSLEHRVESVVFHPTADCILSMAESNCLHLWDVNTSQSIYSNSDHTSLIYSISWKRSGGILGSCGKDKKLRIWDPRDSSKSQVVPNHYSDRDSKITWLGDSDQLITTGLGTERQREVYLRDMRNLSEPVATYTGDTSLKTYIPLFDPDTNMLFLIAQADNAVIFCEVLDYAPFLQEATKHVGDVQLLGAALVPKRALNLMDAEVNRLLLLGKDCIAPLSFQVPRKSYRNFHEDLYPDTYAPEPSFTTAEWQDGQKAEIQKMNLNPNKGGSLVKSDHSFGSGSQKRLLDQSNNNPVILSTSEKESCEEIQSENTNIPFKPEKQLDSNSPQNTKLKTSDESFTKDDKNEIPDLQISKPLETRRVPSFGIRSSKFRHLNGAVFPKETHITDLVSLTKTLPGESDCFHANQLRVAVAIGAGGNFLAILELSKPGRVPAIADMPGIMSENPVMDFCWDPFDCNRLAVGIDNGILQVWDVPEGLNEKLTEPSFSVRGHSERISCLRFHPCAENIIASASSDFSICIYNLASQKVIYQLTGHTDQIFCMAWSLEGTYLASVCKDQKVRIFHPHKSSEPVKYGVGPKGLRGARAAWVLNRKFLAVTGFSKVSERQVYLYDSEDINTPVEDISLDVSPATLVPYYDEDSSTLFLSGKGDATIFAYEICVDSPHFRPLSHYKCPYPHQAFTFLPKCVCDVKKVEFARAVRLTSTTVEMISFHVPRLRDEYFQDDLFPPALQTWKPSMTSDEWISGLSKPLERVDLRPSDMTPLSEAPPPVKPERKPVEPPIGVMFEGEVNMESSLAFMLSGREREEQLVQSMKSQCQLQTSDLPQEEFEGVDPSEWDDDA